MPLLLADLADLLRPLGLQNRRATALRRLTWDYLTGKPPGACHGAGRYAQDALALFCEGRTDLDDVADHWLSSYLLDRIQRRAPAVQWDRAGQRAWRRAQGFPQ
jgi:hypothetical protein